MQPVWLFAGRLRVMLMDRGGKRTIKCLKEHEKDLSPG
jgi:hypothetical protein